MDEQELIRRAASGELGAFDALVERKRDRIFWIAYHVVGDAEAARDVTQEVFFRLFRRLDRFRAGASFDAWLYRIALNLAIDHRRRERPHRETASLDEAGEAAAALPAVEGARQSELRRIFVELSSRLGRKQRAAFILREIEGFSTADVAAILETTESTVRNHVLQARRTLQKEMLRRYPEYCPGRRGG